MSDGITSYVPTIGRFMTKSVGALSRVITASQYDTLARTTLRNSFSVLEVGRQALVNGSTTVSTTVSTIFRRLFRCCSVAFGNRPDRLQMNESPILLLLRHQSSVSQCRAAVVLKLSSLVIADTMYCIKNAIGTRPVFDKTAQRLELK